MPRSMDWPLVQTGKPANPIIQADFFIRQRPDASAEAAAQEGGCGDPARAQDDGDPPRDADVRVRVLGIAVDNNGTKLNIRARKAVIIGTGGSTGNVNFRRMFDPRLTEEYCGLAGMPWSDQDASGELAAMAVGASLWGLYNQTGEFGYESPSPDRSDASMATGIFIGCPAAPSSIAPAPRACGWRIGRTSSW